MRALEEFVYWVSSFGSGADIDSVCAINGLAGSSQKNADDQDFVLEQVNGDLISVIDIGGARKWIGYRDHGKMTANFGKSLEALLKSGSGGQHSFSMGFRSDPGQADDVAGRLLEPMVKTARTFGIKDIRMLKERRKKLAATCVDESVYLVVRTHARTIHPHERKSQMDESRSIREQVKKEVGRLNFGSGLCQGVAMPLGALMPKHQADVKSLLDDLSRDLMAGGAQLIARVLSAHEAIAFIRRHVDSSTLEQGWKPRLLGDRGSVLGSRSNTRSKDHSSAMPTRLSRQIMTSGVKDHFAARELATHAGTWYASLVLEIAPEDGSAPFNELASRIGRLIPWRVSFEILPDGQNYRQMEKMLASLLGAIGDYNKSIRVAFDAIRDLKNSGVYVGAFRMVLTTWSNKKEQTIQNLANLSSAVEGWGAAGCTNETGEPARAMLASAAGFSAVSPAPFIPLPMTDISNMLPFGRPASIWDRGQIIFSTVEGRAYPVEFGSSLQNYWATIGFAPTGSGKSFTLNVLNSGLLLAPGATEIPPITLVDVGLSGALVMQWFKSILPDHLKDQVLAVTIRNTSDHVVNPFDTQHGFDEPLGSDIDFLIAVLGTISPGCGPEAPKYFERVIRVAYERFSRASPDSRRWQNAYDEQIAAKLIEIGFKLTEQTRVWAVVDALFDAGAHDLSMSAQRFAMPRLDDLPKVASDSRISNVYGNARYNQELISEIFTRNLIASLDSYSLLNGYTKFNLGAARAVAIDLQEVVGAMSSEEGRRRSGLMFLLARRIGARNYFLKWDEIAKQCPARYAEYQRTRVTKLWETIKFLQYDEAHYFSGVESVTNLVQADLRTGRKFNLVSAMFSQRLDDFSASVLDNTYIFFIMGMGDASPEKVRETFGLTEDEMDSISTYCIKPGAMFARFKTKMGTLSQIIKLNASIYEQWAFTTQGKDQTLRAALTKYMPINEVLSLLTDRFPEGTAEPYLRRLQASRQGSMEDSALSDMAAELLINEHFSRQNTVETV